jgi:hypothetical protein
MTDWLKMVAYCRSSHSCSGRRSGIESPMALTAWRRHRATAVVPLVCALLGCQYETASKAGAPADRPATDAPEGHLALQPALCSRVGSDSVRDLFCVDTPPVFRSLSELETALQMNFDELDLIEGSNPVGYNRTGDPRVVVLGHSTALSGALVSQLNPRVIVASPESRVFLAFNRGTQQVELAAFDRHLERRNFYLLDFEQACNAAAPGCMPGDLFTPSIESDWVKVVIRDDEDLKNTPSDCRQCHQRGERNPVLLMREFDGPWTNYFGPAGYETTEVPEPSGSDLVQDYIAAKGDEPYAGLPTGVLRATIGFTLQNMVDRPQPLIFEGSTIMNERWPWTETAGYVTQPVRSATWDAAYEAFKRGEQLALPYYAPRATDPDKLSKLSDAYRQYRAGSLAAADLPDFADMFPDDPQTRAEIGLQTEPGATPAEALVQACGTCHSDVLDQTISRARFSIAVSRLARSELDEAVARLRRPRGSPGSMPPPGRRQLDPGTVDALIDYLNRDQRPVEDDALLDRASQLGMAPQRDM